jgi:hypothetical protein
MKPVAPVSRTRRRGAARGRRSSRLRFEAFLDPWLDHRRRVCVTGVDHAGGRDGRPAREPRLATLLESIPASRRSESGTSRTRTPLPTAVASAPSSEKRARSIVEWVDGATRSGRDANPEALVQLECQIAAFALDAHEVPELTCPRDFDSSVDRPRSVSQAGVDDAVGLDAAKAVVLIRDDFERFREQVEQRVDDVRAEVDERTAAGRARGACWRWSRRPTSRRPPPSA